MPFSYWLGWSAFRIMLRGYFRWQHCYSDRVPATGPVILASNHASFIDPPAAGCGVQRAISFLARESLFRYPGIGALLRSWQAVPVDRDGGGAAGLRGIMDRLRQGGAILLFPEGTRTRDGQLRAGRSGIGLLVIKSEAPVVPVRIFGSFEAYGPEVRRPRRHPVTVTYGEPIDFTALRLEALGAPKARVKEIYQEVADRIMGEIAQLQPCPRR